MRKNAQEFRRTAREALGGRWIPAVGVTLLASILGASMDMQSVAGGAFGNSASDEDQQYVYQKITNASPESMRLFWGIFAVIVSVALVYTLVSFIIGSVVSLGLIRYNLNLIDGKRASVGQLFGSMSIWGKAVRLRLRVAIFTFLWSCLLFIPGIVKSYAYSMSGFILEENPEMSPKEAIEISQKMMKGNKWRLFCLDLSFIGWGILSILTCGIGLLWLSPYKNAATAAFYDEISRDQFE